MYKKTYVDHFHEKKKWNYKNYINQRLVLIIPTTKRASKKEKVSPANAITEPLQNKSVSYSQAISTCFCKLPRLMFVLHLISTFKSMGFMVFNLFEDMFSI